MRLFDGEPDEENEIFLRNATAFQSAVMSAARLSQRGPHHNRLRHADKARHSDLYQDSKAIFV
jgi:hypothetical protein